MFSQFSHIRQAVESLAQHQHSAKPSLDSTEDHGHPSLDSVGRGSTSPSQLAESALNNIKKSLAPQRPASPGGSRITPSPSTEGTTRSAQRSTLEDRLRAKFAIGDVSNPTSPNLSSRSSPVSTSVPVTNHPLSPVSTPLPETPAPPVVMENPHSPTSTPLPDSPALSPKLAIDSPLPMMLDTPAPLFLHAASPAPSSDGVLAAESLAATAAVLSHPDGASSLAASTEDQPGDRALQNDDTSPSSADSDPSPEHHNSASAQSITEEDESAKPDEPTAHGDNALNVEANQVSASSEHKLANEERKQEDSQQSLDAPVPESKGVAVNGEMACGTIPDGFIVPAPSDVQSANAELDVDALQKRLKLVEQRFSDVSTSFKRLQAEKLAADKLLQELTPVESMQEVDALRDYLQNVNFKAEMAQDEIKRLNGKLTRQDERIEELRDIHRLESKSQSDLIDRLRAQVDEAEALLKATQNSTAHFEEASVKQKAEVERLQAEAERLKGVAKEEEEKRVKAVALLKTVRQKLVKAEKERDEALKEVQSAKEKDKEEREREKRERAELQKEIEKVNAERETAILGLRTQFDKEVAGLKDKYEKEVAALKSQVEIEAVTTKNSHIKELETRNSWISRLESSVQALSSEKDNLFDQLQLRQAELESARSHLESLEGRGTEYQFQLREAGDQIALLTEELADIRREQEAKGHIAGPSTEEVTRMLSATEAKYESRIGELRQRLTATERERDEGEAEWSRKLSEKAKEIETLKAALNASARHDERESEDANALKEEILSLKEEIRTYETVVSDLRLQAGKVTELEDAAKSQLAELSSRAAVLQQSLEDSKGREAQLRAHNKTLREELRKVQSSAALLEKQRNPGVGYWASRQDSVSESRSPRTSVSDLPSRDSPRPGSPSTVRSDEELNVEYLRNVILQFLEHKEMRPHLVRILSTILRFTPQETRRLVSKV